MKEVVLVACAVYLPPSWVVPRMCDLTSFFSCLRWKDVVLLFTESSTLGDEYETIKRLTRKAASVTVIRSFGSGFSMARQHEWTGSVFRDSHSRRSSQVDLWSWDDPIEANGARSTFAPTKAQAQASTMSPLCTRAR